MANPVPRRAGYPTAIERTYRRRLLAHVRALHLALMSRLGKVLDRLGEQIDEIARQDAADRARRAHVDAGGAIVMSAPLARPKWRQDAADDLVESLLAVVDTVRRGAAQAFKPDEEGIEAIARQLDLFASRQLRKTIKRVARVSIVQTAEDDALFREFVSENVAKITSISSAYFDDIEKSIRDSFDKGRTTRKIRDEIQARYGVSRSRATLIARDQISKLNGQITEHKQTSLGITRYVWSSSGDERVRPSHAANDGKVFEWSKPPPETGHPGNDYQCRCIAEPIFDDEDPEEVAQFTREQIERERSKRAARS